MPGRSPLPSTTSTIGALLLSLGLAAQPASAGGHHHGKHVAQYVAVPAGGQAGYYAPAVASYYPAPATYYAAPAASAGYSYYAQPGSFAGYYGTAALASFGTAPLAGFSTTEMAAYNTSPTLAYHLGGQFAQFHKKLVSHARTLKRNNFSGNKLLQALKAAAPSILNGILPNIPVYGPIFEEIMNLVEGIAGQADKTAPTTRRGQAGGGGVIPSGRGGTIPEVDASVDDPPTANSLTDPGDEPTLLDLQISINSLAEAVKNLQSDAPMTTDAARAAAKAAKAADAAKAVADAAKTAADAAKAAADAKAVAASTAADAAKAAADAAKAAADAAKAAADARADAATKAAADAKAAADPAAKAAAPPADTKPVIPPTKG